YRRADGAEQRPQAQVLLHRQFRDHPSAFGDVGDTGPGDVLGVHSGEVRPAESDPPRLWSQQSRHRAEQRGLARTVCSQHGGDPPSGRGEVHVVERGDRAVTGGQPLHPQPVAHHAVPPGVPLVQHAVHARASSPRYAVTTAGSAAISSGAPDAITLPKSRTVIRSHTDITRSMWWSTSTTAIRSDSARTSSPSSPMSLCPSPLAGSSRSRSSGSETSARA